MRTGDILNDLKLRMSLFLGGAICLALLGLAALASSSAPAFAQDLGTRDRAGLALKGDIYFLKRGASRLPDFDSLRPRGTIYVTELNVTPRSFRRGFPGVADRFEWFAIDYSGRIAVARSGTYRFSLTSDDGSMLIIDGRTVIDNDGTHAPQTKKGSIDLTAGVHDIRVQYFQGPAHEIALVLEAAFGDGAYETFPTADIKLVAENWWEVLMDTTTVIATFALLAFMVERLTNGIALLLGYSAWWRDRMEISGIEEPGLRARNERNRRAALFGIGVVLAVPGALLMGIDILAQLQLPGLPEQAGRAITGLLIASGADPIRELIRSRDLRDRQAAAPQPVQVAGTLVLQQPAMPADDKTTST